MDEVNDLIAKHYNATFEDSSSFSLPKDPEPMLRQFLFLLSSLMERGLTLSAICLKDFKISDHTLFLKKDTHITKLVEGHFFYRGDSACFSPGKSGKHSLASLYHSVALFAYYLWTHKKVDKLSHFELEELKGTKVYYFIRNAMEKHPILLYL
jgi:hypothetical protein